MENHSGRLTREVWQQIASAVGPGFHWRQVQARWLNFLRPPLDRSEISPVEKWLILRYSVLHYGQWQFIASRLGDGTTRSPAMVSHAFSHLAQKLKAHGFEVNRPEDADLMPVEVFQRGFPKGKEGEKLLEDYKRKKSVRDSAVSRQFTISALLVPRVAETANE
jgi:hypothetical protein